MPELRAFHGVRFSPSIDLKRVVCPPYDVISPEQQAELYERDPHNAVRLELPREEGDAVTRYERAGQTFQEWMAEGTLQADETASLYVYRQDFRDDRGRQRRVSGTIGALRLEGFGTESGVLPHERTMPGPKQDRLALMNACPVNISPIYAIYRGDKAFAAFFNDLGDRPPQARFADADGTLHRMWVIQAPAEVDLLAGAIAPTNLVIADGHHRYETALAFHEQHTNEPGGHDSIMCFCVDADDADLLVLPYNRAVKTDVAPEMLAARLHERFSTVEIRGDWRATLNGSRADHPFVFAIWPSSTILVELSDDEVAEVLGDRAPAWRSLDVVVLHEIVLSELLGDSPAEFVFSKDPGEVIDLVRHGGCAVAILLRPLHATDVVEVARSGERMPQKASYFSPKAVTGLVFHPLS